ncbi:EF-hand domain-containing protein D2-like [Argiope bruennichi]|uniref:EF-hand domain-containing protein D2-like n=1 Tax=Argiope bruennichi TaxID=94029 RepID=UPI0024956E34|nr:EF-hand domain-containing protein D2-like [Argiope bruennichi]
MADSELSAILSQRQIINEGNGNGDTAMIPNKKKYFNPYTEFKEFSMKEIKEYERMFKKFDVGNDGFIDLEELKRMMEVLGAPQTHLALKQMIKEVDEDLDKKISFREFMLIYRKARAGELDIDGGLSKLASLTEIDVDEAGVGGAKTFFEAKIAEQAASSKFEEEIRAEQEERKREEELRRKRQAAFKEKANFFGQVAAQNA